jgi:hypothetical protein
MTVCQKAICVRAAHSHKTDQENIWLRSVRVPMIAALLLSLAACANQSVVSPASEPLSVTDNPGAVGR